MAEVWFDPDSQHMLIYPYDNGDVPDDAVLLPLGALLQTDTFPYQQGDFNKIDAEDWGQEKVLAVGKLAVMALESDVTPPLLTNHMSRLAILGLLPYRDVFRKFYGTFSEYKTAVGSAPGYDRVAFADWGIAEFAEYASRTSNLLGYLPKIEDYKRQFLEGRGPSFSLIEDRIGGIKSLHELIGYPNTQEWIDDDFVDWGIRVMQANPDQDFSLPMIEALSRKKRGPSVWTIYHKFTGGWASMRGQVLEEGRIQLDAESAARKQNLELCNALIDGGELDIDATKIPEEDILSLGGRYRVLRAVTSDLTEAQKRRILSKQPELFISELRSFRPNVTAGYIEMKAVAMNVFNDIWPSVNGVEHLQVPQSEIDYYRTLHAHKKRAARLDKAS